MAYVPDHIADDFVDVDVLDVGIEHSKMVFDVVMALVEGNCNLDDILDYFQITNSQIAHYVVIIRLFIGTKVFFTLFSCTEKAVKTYQNYYAVQVNIISFARISLRLTCGLVQNKIAIIYLDYIGDYNVYFLVVTVHDLMSKRNFIFVPTNNKLVNLYFVYGLYYTINVV